jgi:hypothetical protein
VLRELSVRDDVVEAWVVPWEPGEFGVAYRTSDGREGAERIGSQSEAAAVARRALMRRSVDEFDA